VKAVFTPLSVKKSVPRFLWGKEGDGIVWMGKHLHVFDVTETDNFLLLLMLKSKHLHAFDSLKLTTSCSF
jgi:hypothetical protein